MTSLQKVATSYWPHQLDFMVFYGYTLAEKEKNHKGILILENVFYFSEKKKRLMLSIVRKKLTV